jgi:hypothetical protein
MDSWNICYSIIGLLGFTKGVNRSNFTTYHVQDMEIGILNPK